MKKKGFLSLSTLLLLFGLTACPLGGGGGVVDDGGEQTYVGTKDGHYKIDSKGNKIGDTEPHVLVDSEGDAQHKPVPAECEMSGKACQKCTICNKIVDKVVPALGHDWVGSSDPEKAATCTKAGLQECSRCDKTRESGEPLGHQLVADTSNIEGVTKQKCTRPGCTGGTVTLDVSKASGWNKADTNMNGKTSPDNKSTWNVAGVLEDGTYDIQIEGIMSYTSHGDRKWYNMAKAELCIGNQVEETATSDPDTTSQDDYRYFFKVNDNVTINPTVKDSWSELGYQGQNDSGSAVYGYICKDVQITGANTFCLYHGNIGFSMIISNIKLIKH